jgi:bifunctional non-homologous end joining protein LigD
MPDLDRYRDKRDFELTPEPEPGLPGPGSGLPRFVVQQHHARRLHWDLRLEHDGVAASWAIPNGIPLSPKENRLAVHTEDHPLEYLEFKGEIPAGQYGAGTMGIWDHGTYELHEFDEKKVEVTFHGERLHGRYGMFPIGRTPADVNNWMIHRMDPPDDPARVPMPEGLKPMLARAGEMPLDQQKWSFEVKWDGVRAVAYAKPGRLRLDSRNGNEITAGYPEVRGLIDQLGMREAVLDGELVAFDAQGRPSFGRLQERMHVREGRALQRLVKSVPVVFAIFDLLYLDGESLLALPYSERRERLSELALDGPAWRVPDVHAGDGERLLAATAAQGLEGIVAKRLDARYEPGARNGAWLKLKNTQRQELVIGGWLPGEGGRAGTLGSLLTGYYDGGELIYAGRVGTGFTDRTLGELTSMLEPLRRPSSPFSASTPKLPREAVYVEPELVCEVEFVEWTADGVMRAPSFKGLRDDKAALEVVRERPNLKLSSVSSPGGFGDGPLEFAGRSLKLSNYDKVLFPESGFTKGDLIEYYAAAAEAVLPHLRDRALTLKRYPNGVDKPFFYEKNSPSHRPDWVPTAEIGGVSYTLCQEPAALVWLANLADVELHTSLAYAAAPDCPSLLVFDLDPGPPAGLVECCQVALVLRGMFGALGLTSVVKTSGSKGMQVYVPIDPALASFSETKTFAKQVAELLEQRLPELVVSRMTKSLRPGRVFVDWSQNDDHKTTATVYSVRALPTPGVSTPLRWEEVSDCLEAGDAGRLVFTPAQVLERIGSLGDLFAEAATVRQALPALS